MLGELLAKVGVIVQTLFFRQYEVVCFQISKENKHP